MKATQQTKEVYFSETLDQEIDREAQNYIVSYCAKRSGYILTKKIGLRIAKSHKKKCVTLGAMRHGVKVERVFVHKFF